MSNAMHKTKKNFISALFFQVITLCLGLIIPKITINGYGSEINGLLSSATQLVAYLVLFEAGIQQVAEQALYKTIGTNDHIGTNQIISAVHSSYKKIGIFYFLGLISLAALYPVIIRNNNIDYWLVFGVVFFSGIGNVIVFFYHGKYRILLKVEGKSYILTNVNAIISILNHVSKIVLLYFGLNVVFVLFISFVISLIQIFYIKCYLAKKYKWVNVKEKPNFKALKQNKQALLHQVSYLIFANTDALLLTMFCDLKVVSVYTLYKLIITSVNTFLHIPLDSCSFKLGQLCNTQKEKYKTYIDTFEVFHACFVFAIYTVTLFLFTPFISIYTKGVTDINYVDKFLVLIFIASEILTFSRYPMLRTISYAGHFQQTLGRSLLESAINIVASLILVNFIGIYGVIIGTIIALLYRTTDVIIYANKKILNRKPLKTFLIYLVNFITLLFISLFMSALEININSIFEFLYIGLISMIIVLIIFFAINIILFKNERKQLMMILKKLMHKKGNRIKEITDNDL